MVEAMSEGDMTRSFESCFTVRNELGLHARAAMRFVQLAARFESDIWVRKGDREVNGKSIMGMLMLVATKGTDLYLRAVGPDAKALVEALGRLIEERFGEEA